MQHLQLYSRSTGCHQPRGLILSSGSVTCRKTSGKPYAMPDPPPFVKSQVSNTDPLTVTGVDYTGALYVRTPGGKSRFIFVCLLVLSPAQYI